MKKRLALILASAMLVTSAVAGLTSCKSGGAGGEGGSSENGHVYYLNFKPEVDGIWQDLAKKYTEETGITVDITTAADGKYEETLASEISKADAPTLFQINGPTGLANWKDYCYDLSDAAVTKELTDKAYALNDVDGATRGIAYVTESYGLITNTKLLKEAGYEITDITNFESLKKVAEDITAKKAAGEINFSAFTNAALASGDWWRMQTHLANLPLYYEYKDGNVDPGVGLQEIKGTYMDNFRQILDLYLDNATCERSVAASKKVDDARTEFVNGEAVFYQNGAWEYNKDSGLMDMELGFLPIYIGVEGEENQSVCTGTENFWAVNSQASEEDIQATLDFLEWVVTDDEVTKVMADDMGFSIPFKNAKPVSNKLTLMANDMVSGGKTNVSWALITMPSQAWKDNLGSFMAAYASDKTDEAWDGVVKAYVDNWKVEKDLVAEATKD